jgi:hypothetical protein
MLEVTALMTLNKAVHQVGLGFRVEGFHNCC